MNRERLMAQGAMAEMRAEIRRLDTEIKGHKLFIREQLAPFVDISAQAAAQVEVSAQRLHANCERLEKLRADLAKLEADWG